MCLRGWVHFVQAHGRPVSIQAISTTPCKESAFWEVHLGECEEFMQLAMTQGPHSYQAFAEVVKERYQFEVSTSASQINGPCLLHQERGESGIEGLDVGHCCPIQAGGHATP